MIYRSNLTCPDLSSHFKLRHPPKLIMGHDAPSDPDFEPECCFITHDEAAILYNIVKQVGGEWADIGSRFCWSTAHIASAAEFVYAVDPLYGESWARERASSNVEQCQFYQDILNSVHWPSGDGVYALDGFFIDGNHDHPFPMQDAAMAWNLSHADSVIVFHDFWGGPIRKAVSWLMELDYKTRVYYTPNGVACCWRGLPEFYPPDHVRDGNIDWRGIEAMIKADFPMERCV